MADPSLVAHQESGQTQCSRRPVSALDVHPSDSTVAGAGVAGVAGAGAAGAGAGADVMTDLWPAVWTGLLSGRAQVQLNSGGHWFLV